MQSHKTIFAIGALVSITSLGYIIKNLIKNDQSETPTDHLSDLGYTWNNQGELINIQTGEMFQFEDDEQYDRIMRGVLRYVVETELPSVLKVYPISYCNLSLNVCLVGMRYIMKYLLHR